DQVHHRLEAYQGFSFPVHTDKREHPVLDLVPLASPRRIVTHYHLPSGFITEALQVVLPGPVAIPVAAPAVGADEHLPRSRVVPTAEDSPPASDTLHREFGRVLSKNSISLRAQSLRHQVWCTGKATAGCYDGTMRLAIDPFRLLLISLAGWFNPQQQAVIEYL